MIQKEHSIDVHKCTTAQLHTYAGNLRPVLLCLMLCICTILITTSPVYADASSAKYKEYEVKAAFLFNFLKFIDWPGEKTAANNNQFVIGIIGEDPFGPAADVFKDKTVEDRKLLLKRFQSFEQIQKLPEKDKNEHIDEIKRCHLLFICQSEQKQIADIIEVVRNNNVLTVADTDGFIEAGGIINFLTEENKIRFDINQTAAEKTGLKIRSQLLRLAKRVITDSLAAKNTSKQEGN